ncbi:MAG: HisA/HisF-related TIM barrel protein [Gammaproteobacteria bacterium]
MEIIPVIDIKGGRAVHARQGLRERYQPLATRLCSSGDVFSLAAALLSDYPFKTIYIADLDALAGVPSNRDLIQELINRFPQTGFWVDQGLNPPLAQACAKTPVCTVIGSESLNESMLGLLAKVPSDRTILSLDFSASGLLGPKVLLQDDRLWPERTIVMNLPSVGAEQGPDWERCEFFCRRWPSRKLIAAGGVRHECDLKRLARLGFSGALIATALHRGTISASFIEGLMAE